jgi:hypothetical protein
MCRAEGAELALTPSVGFVRRHCGARADSSISGEPMVRPLGRLHTGPVEHRREVVMHASIQNAEAGFEVRFESLFDESRGLVFPCDALGRVDLDALPPRARSNYLYARALVGRDYATPKVSRCNAGAFGYATA